MTTTTTATTVTVVVGTLTSVVRIFLKSMISPKKKPLRFPAEALVNNLPLPLRHQPGDVTDDYCYKN